jgi:hypothetical protein
MELALTDLFRARWTNEIHDEWIRNVLADRPDLRPEQLNRTKELMNKSVRDAIVEGYQDLIDALELPDPNDRHVLAAAIRCNASIIVTYNLKDFPPSHIEKYDIEAQHPDEFIYNHLDLNSAIVCRAVDTVWRRLKKPPYTREEYLEILLRQSLPQTVSLLKERW